PRAPPRPEPQVRHGRGAGRGGAALVPRRGPVIGERRPLRVPRHPGQGHGHRSSDPRLAVGGQAFQSIHSTPRPDPMRAPVVILGGGAAGLTLALELGRRGVRAVVLEEDAGPPEFPKANATTSRTMEHFRRLGFAHEVRALGMPEDYPQDVTYFTRFTR